MFYLFLLLINAGFACVVAYAAKEKGHSPVGFWFLSFFTSFVIGIIVVAIVKNKKEGDGKLSKAEESSNALQDNFLGKHLVFTFLFLIYTYTLLTYTSLGMSMGIFRMAGRTASKILISSSYVAILGFATIISARAKGPDFSIPATMGLAGMLFASCAQSSDCLIIGVIVALLVCIVIGALNGSIIVYLKTPAILTTIVTSIIIGGITGFVAKGETVGINLGDFTKSIWFFIIMILFTLVATTMLLVFTKLGKPIEKRTVKDMNSIDYFVAYIASSLIAGIAGIMFAIRLHAGSPIMGRGMLIYVVIFYTIISASRLCYKKIVSPLVVLGTAYILSFLIMNYNIHGIETFFQDIIMGVITLGFVVIMFVARKQV